MTKLLHECRLVTTYSFSFRSQRWNSLINHYPRGGEREKEGEEGKEGEKASTKTEAHVHSCGPEGSGAKPVFILLPFIGLKKGTPHDRDFPKRCVTANANLPPCTAQVPPIPQGKPASS